MKIIIFISQRQITTGNEEQMHSIKPINPPPLQSHYCRAVVSVHVVLSRCHCSYIQQDGNIINSLEGLILKRSAEPWTSSLHPAAPRCTGGGAGCCSKGSGPSFSSNQQWLPVLQCSVFLQRLRERGWNCFSAPGYTRLSEPSWRIVQSRASSVGGWTPAVSTSSASQCRRLRWKQMLRYRNIKLSWRKEGERKVREQSLESWLSITFFNPHNLWLRIHKEVVDMSSSRENSTTCSKLLVTIR